MNRQPRAQTDNALNVIALHHRQRHGDSLISPAGRSEWRDRNAKAESRAEGEIELRGTIAAEDGGLHMGSNGTAWVFVGAMRRRK